MARYVDGYVIPIKKTKVKLYTKFAKLGKKMWMKYGALDYYETVGDDLKAKWGLGFPKMCKLKKDETAIFAFIVYKNKAHRNKVNKKVMSAMPLDASTEMPFNMNRFAVGGFKVITNA